jgi:RNA-directed DNA polymerase
MKTIIELDNIAAKKFFLKGESYCTIDLPPYFDFTKMLSTMNLFINKDSIRNCCKQIHITMKKSNLDYPSNYDNVNYEFFTNKDGRYAWRPLQLIHPVFYIVLVNCITKKENWDFLLSRFDEFMENKNIKCISVPIVSETKISDKAETVLNWWQEIEQESIKLSMDYNYMFKTDITNCYGSIYTHSIVWAIHGKELGKDRKGDQTLFGNIIDQDLQGMSYGQTNGIPQGSILMDFLAEILLGYIDFELSEKLKSSNIKDYKILRYRDDYRIFANEPSQIEQIAKILSGLLSNVGLKLNVEKTSLSKNIIIDSIKSDKLFFIKNKTDWDSIQKKLLFIHSLNTQFPNSGRVLIELSFLNKYIIEERKIKEDIEVLISIIVDIMKSSPKTYSSATAVISRLLSFVDNDLEKKRLILKVHQSLKNIPNNEHLFVWLQRLIYPVNKKLITFNNPLCSIVDGRSSLENIWNSEWLDKEIRGKLHSTSIVDSDKLAELSIIIDRSEVDLFDSY